MSNIVDLYPHNRIVYLKVLETLKTNNKVGIVQATGTGKGKLAACLIDDVLSINKNARILIVAPLHSILENYKTNFNVVGNNIKYATYSKINNLMSEELSWIGKNYSLIILDEYHRAGAPEWIKSVQSLFIGVDKGSCKVVGLTATPIRYLDNSRDMSKELFGDVIIQGIGLEDAIVDGILPCFTYNACYFGSEKFLAELETKLKTNEYKISDDVIRNDLLVKVKELSMIYKNRYKIENIIKENTKKLGANQKWVIFCRDKKSLKAVREYCITWFISHPNLYVMTSDREALDNSRTLSAFREIKSGINVLLCVNMLNEGVHIKDLNGVIMLRKTDSPIIFMQQLGRALEVGKEFNPIIFDLIGNYRGLKTHENELEKTPIKIIKGIETKTKNNRNYVIVHNFVEELDNVLNEIKQLSNGGWSAKEYSLLHKFYPLGGSQLCLEKGINRTLEAIERKASYLGLTLSKCFTQKELEILRTYYSYGGAKLCIEKGINRPEYAIRNKASYEGLYFKKEESLDYLKIREFYPKGGSQLCIDNGVNLEKRKIKNIAARLGLTYDITYTDVEIQKIQKYYPIGGAELCIKKGVNRANGSIQKKAQSLGISLINHFYSEEEELILRTYYPIGGAELCIEKGLNRIETNIQAKAKKMGISTKYRKGGWSDKDITILQTYYPIGGADLCIVKGLRREKSSIVGKASKLNIKYSK